MSAAPFTSDSIVYSKITASLLLCLGLVSCTAAGSGPRTGPAAVGRPPNVVFIMADDLGWGDIGPNGQERIQTPNLERMAREGVRFTSFYAGSTVCAPSRSVLLTGQHTGRTPIRGNSGKLRTGPWGEVPLPAEAVTLAEVLDRAGYATGGFGKWGLGGPGSEGVPTRQGFDAFYGYLDHVRAHFYYPEFLFRGETRVPLVGNRVASDAPAPGAGWAVEPGRYSHDAIADEALAFIDEHREGPFFLYVPFTIPHAELQVPEDAYAPYLDANGQSIFPETPYPGQHYGPQPMPRATYAAMITRMDRDIGRILERLEELGIAENTLVFFTSDNGPSTAGGIDPEFFNSNGPFRGRKRDLYEGGIRVPMVVWGPGRVPAGRVSDHVWAAWDVLPTLAELAGADAPDDIDGLSMANALTGRGPAPEHESLYWEFYEGTPAQAVRMGRWKAIRQPMLSGPIELYDLQADPGEQRDVAAQHPEIVERARAAMRQAHTPSPMWKAPAAAAAK
jgi:arylsulfatase A